MIPKLEVLNDSSSSSSSNNNNGLIVFAQAQDFVVHYPTNVVPVGPQFIINYTVYTTLYYDGVGTNNLAFEVQPYVTEPSWSGASGAGPGPRIIKMTSDYHQVGNHVIQMDTITNMAPDNLPTGIESITMKYADAADGGFPLTDLPHDAIVLSFIKYTTPTDSGPGAYFTRGNFLFKMDIETDPGTLRSPTSNQGISVRFSLQFVLPEAALPGSLFLNVYPTEGDTNGKRRIKIADTVYQPGVHSIDMDAFSTVASTSSDIASVSPAINMVSQAKYIFGFEYQDSLGNPPTEVNSTNVFHDTETLPPTVIAPISGARVPATFTFTFELPEVGLNQSVMLDIAKTNTKDPDCPTDVNDAGYCPDDTNEDRNIVFMGDFQTIGTHTFTVPVNGLDSLAGSNNNVLRVSPEVDLVHGQQYMFIFRYQDYAGNDEKTDSRIVIFDSKTISPVLNTPVCGNRVPPIFELSFTLEEVALADSVVLNMTRVGGYNDPDSWRAVTFSSLFEVKGTHIISMTNFSMLAATSTFVDSVAPQVDLVNEVTYGIRICYQDAASNLEACTSPYGSCNVTFDSATLAPIILSPAENSTVPVDFDLNFTLLEDMSPGTCKLIVTQTGGLQDPVPNPRRLTFSNDIYAAGTYSYKMSNTYFQNGASFFSSVETAFGLNDGTFYSFEVQCQDTVQNTLASGINVGIGYAGIETIAPVFVSPATDGCVAIGSQISFQLIERALPGSVKLTVSPTTNCLAVGDSAAGRVIAFSNTVSDAGTYSFDLSTLTTLALQGVIDSVAPTTSFVDSVLYSYALQYQDAASNPATTTTSTGVAFSGTETQVPSLTLPASGSAIGQAFTVNFTLPERALRGSVKMRFNRVSGFEDPVGERVVIFSSEVEQCGAHVVVIGGEGLETATQISAIESIIPSVGLGTTDLIDGATYNITIEYQDCGGHTKSVSSPNTVTYAGITTLPPVLTRPGTRASIPREFYFEFELPEVPCPTEKVTITFLRSGGLIQDSFQGTRTVQLDIATGGLHIFKMTDLSNAASLSQVSSVIPATDLVHGSKYLVDIFYQDAVCNPIQTAGSVEVTFAGNFTLAPIFYFPASSTVLSQTFNIKFVFVEAGLQNSTTITFTPLVPDSSPPPNVCGYATTDSLSHVLMLDDFSEGIQDFNMPSTLFSGAGAASSAITSISPASADLIDGACYDVKLSYQDGASHPAASVTHVLIRYAGNETLPLSSFVPQSGSRVKEAFSFQYSLIEPAQATTLKLTISPIAGGETDSNGDRVISFQGDALFAGPHTLSFQALSTIVLDVNVLSCFIGGSNNCIDMVHDAYYKFTLEYRDAVGNAPQTVEQTQLRFDTATGAPTFTLPAAASFIPEPFSLIFELPEPALAGSVQLQIDAESGNIVDDDGVSSRLIVLGPSYEFGPELTGTTRHVLEIGPLSELNSTGNITSISNTSGLVDGASYTFTFSYQDDAANARASVVHSGVVFAHNKTITPLLNLPASSTSYTASKPVDIFVYEKAQGSSLQMRIQFSRMGRWATANDTAGDRILTFASSFEDPGPHACTIKAMDVTQPSCIASVTNGVQLMHGGIYNILLSMQDFVGNPVSTATNYMIEHDVETATPVFSEPSKNRIKVAFVIQFTLPENATAGTVKVKIDSLDVTLDPTGTRTIVFSNPIQYENSYTFTMTNLSIAATNVTNIESVSPAVDLVHGVQYVMKVEYRDYLANSRAEMFSAESVMTFDTFTEPIFILSPTTGNTFREAFPLQFQLSERATENTVKITFTRTGGEVDNDSPHEVIFSVTTGQTYDVTMGALSGLASANALVISSSSNDLKHHATLFEVVF